MAISCADQPQCPSQSVPKVRGSTAGAVGARHADGRRALSEGIGAWQSALMFLLRTSTTKRLCGKLPCPSRGEESDLFLGVQGQLFTSLPVFTGLDLDYS